MLTLTGEITSVRTHACRNGRHGSKQYTHANDLPHAHVHVLRNAVHASPRIELAFVRQCLLLFFSCILLSCQLDLSYVYAPALQASFLMYATSVNHLVTQLRTYATTSGFYTYISMSKCETTRQQPIRSSLTHWCSSMVDLEPPLPRPRPWSSSAAQRPHQQAAAQHGSSQRPAPSTTACSFCPRSATGARGR